jgi:hypothetical protein
MLPGSDPVDLSFSPACRLGKLACDAPGVSTVASSAFQTHAQIEAIWDQTPFVERLGRSPHATTLGSNVDCDFPHRSFSAKTPRYKFWIAVASAQQRGASRRGMVSFDPDSRWYGEN